MSVGGVGRYGHRVISYLKGAHKPLGGVGGGVGRGGSKFDRNL